MYDVIIIGAGAGGMGAAVYSIRFHLKTLLISKTIGGVALDAPKIENWLGEKSITGIELMEKFHDHVKSLNVETKQKEVDIIDKTKNGFKVNNNETKSIIFATGSIRRKLPAKGADKFEGKGVSYCATCDAPFFKNKTVVVAGGGDAATVAAIQLAKHAKKVSILYRGKALKAEPINQESVKQNKKIEIKYQTEIIEILGDKNVQEILLKNGEKMQVDGVFVEIGAMPATELAGHIGVKFSDHKEIIVDKFQRTNVKNVYAVGDCTDSPFKQIITAAAEGAVASLSCFQDLHKINK